MDVLDNIDAEAVSGDGGEYFSGALPPGQIVWGAPGGDGTEEQLEVILLGQFLCRRHKAAQLHQDLRGAKRKATDAVGVNVYLFLMGISWIKCCS